MTGPGGARPKSQAKKLVLLTADQVLDADDLPEVELEIPEWGGLVKVRALGWQELRDAREASKVGGVVDQDKFAIGLILEGLVEPKLRADQAGLLQQRNKRALERIVERIEVLSGLSEEEAASAEAAFPE